MERPTLYELESGQDVFRAKPEAFHSINKSARLFAHVSQFRVVHEETKAGSSFH